MKRSLSASVSALFLTSVLMSTPAMARSSRGGEGDIEHNLSVAAGVASPSRTTSLFENPAGLTFVTSTELLGEARTNNSSWDPTDVGGHIYFGNGSVGAGLGAWSDSSLQLGIAADLKAFALGVSLNGTTKSGGIGADDVDIGVLFLREKDVRFGAMVRGLSSGNSYGLGIATDISSSATFALDVGANSSVKGIGIKPGLEIHLPEVQIAVGYGIHTDKQNPSWIGKDVSVGLGFGLGKGFRFQGYYNQLAKYYLGVSVML